MVAQRLADGQASSLKVKHNLALACTRFNAFRSVRYEPVWAESIIEEHTIVDSWTRNSALDSGRPISRLPNLDQESKATMRLWLQLQPFPSHFT